MLEGPGEGDTQPKAARKQGKGGAGNENAPDQTTPLVTYLSTSRHLLSAHSAMNSSVDEHGTPMIQSTSKYRRI